MPVYRWKNLDDMAKHRWLQPGDPRIWQRFCAVLDIAGWAVKLHRPPGVYRFRTIEEMQEFQDGWRVELIGQGKDLPPKRRDPGRVAEAPRTPFGRLPEAPTE